MSAAQSKARWTVGLTRSKSYVQLRRASCSTTTQRMREVDHLGRKIMQTTPAMSIYDGMCE